MENNHFCSSEQEKTMHNVLRRQETKLLEVLVHREVVIISEKYFGNMSCTQPSKLYEHSKYPLLLL